MRNLFNRLALATFALAAVPAAYADSVIFPNPGYAHGSESVTYTLFYGASDPRNLATASAGAGGFLTSLNGGPTFESYCVDLYHTINFNVLYTDYTAPGTTHVFANSSAYADLGKLYAVAGGAVTNSTTEAAFQMAAWEIAFENTGSYSFGAGSAQFSSNSAVTTQATTWLNAVALSSGGPAIRVLDSREHQAVMTPVPEPETYALLMAGLGAIGFMARRRRS